MKIAHTTRCNIRPILIGVLCIGMAMIIAMSSCKEWSDEVYFDIEAIPGPYACEHISFWATDTGTDSAKIICVLEDTINMCVQRFGTHIFKVYIDSFRTALNPDSFIALPILIIDLLKAEVAGQSCKNQPFSVRDNGYIKGAYNIYNFSIGRTVEQPCFRFSYPTGYYIEFPIVNMDPENGFTVCLAGKKQF